MPLYPRLTFSDAIAMERGCSSEHRDNQGPLASFLTLGNWRKMCKAGRTVGIQVRSIPFRTPSSAKVRPGFAPSRSAKPGKTETFRSGSTYE
jgi:hypothetical protein